MINLPEVKIGIVAVSRDCFPESLSVNRRKALVEAYKAKYDEADIYECPICIVDSEIHMHWWFILETLDRRSLRPCWQSTLMAPLCLWLQQKRAGIA